MKTVVCRVEILSLCYLSLYQSNDEKSIHDDAVQGERDEAEDDYG